MAGHSLGAANFPKTDDAQLDAYVMPADYKLEPRPRNAADVWMWHRDALRESWAICCVIGEDHYPERAKAADRLLELHETQTHIWPRDIVFDVWAELA